MQVSATTSGQKFSIKVHLPKNIYYIAYVDQMDRGSTSITSGSSVTGGVGAGVAIAEAADGTITSLPALSRYISNHAFTNGSMTGGGGASLCASGVGSAAALAF
jgi:hypothetical protein